MQIMAYIFVWSPSDQPLKKNTEQAHSIKPKVLCTKKLNNWINVYSEVIS